MIKRTKRFGLSQRFLNILPLLAFLAVLIHPYYLFLGLFLMYFFSTWPIWLKIIMTIISLIFIALILSLALTLKAFN